MHSCFLADVITLTTAGLAKSRFRELQERRQCAGRYCPVVVLQLPDVLKDHTAFNVGVKQPTGWLWHAVRLETRNTYRILMWKPFKKPRWHDNIKNDKDVSWMGRAQ
jgi:hypothetical protein